MNLTNQELKNNDRNVEAAELVRDFANLFRFITENLCCIGAYRYGFTYS
jgi:hypothetical protein